MYKYFATSLIASAMIFSGCASAPYQPIIAQEKTVEYDGQTYVFGGEFHEKKEQITITVNGDPIMRGVIRGAFNPTLNIKADYNGMSMASYCYLGSVLQSERGAVGLISGVIQSQKGKSGDTCEVKIDGNIVGKLYF